MATIQGPSKRGSIEKRALMEKMDGIFKTSPYKAKARDGSGDSIALEHRIGKDAGAPTIEELMKKLGLNDEYSAFAVSMQRKLKNDEENLEKVLTEKLRILRSKANHTVSSYRRRLEEFYGKYPSRPLLPMFAFVRTGEREDGLYIQGLLDAESHKLVIGEPEDDLLWCETVFQKTKSFADLNHRAELTAKALASLPGINKDLKFRAHRIGNGELPEKRIEFKG